VLRRIDGPDLPISGLALGASDAKGASTFEAVLPAGRYQVAVDRQPAQLVTIEPESTVIELAVDAIATRSSDIQVWLSTDGVTRPMPMSWWQKARLFDSLGQELPISRTSYHGSGFTGFLFGATFTVPFEGAVRLELPPIADCLPIASIEAQLRSGQAAVVSVEVVDAF
jgi:hypothetical protein